MFPTERFPYTEGDWSEPNGSDQDAHYGGYGFDTQAVYGLEPEAGPSTATEFTQPGYDGWMDGTVVVPIETGMQYPYQPGWEPWPPAPTSFLYSEHACSEPQIGVDTPTPVSPSVPQPTPPPPPPPVPSSSSLKRAEKRQVKLKPEQISSFKELLRGARPPGGYKPEAAIAAVQNILRDVLPTADVRLSSRPHFDGELYLEDVLKQHLGASNKTDMYGKLVAMFGSMGAVNPTPTLRRRSVGPHSHQTGKTQAAAKKVEASSQRRRLERSALELLSQRFRLPVGMRRFSKPEILSLVLAHLIAPDDTEGAELVEDRDPPPNAAP